jgi:hypothetical protein
MSAFSENQTFQALDGLNVQRRVVITGTPIQVRVQPSKLDVNLTDRIMFPAL